MKLTKDEIRAIASTIVKQKREEFKKELDKKVKDFKSSAKNKALAKKYHDAFKSIPSDIMSTLHYRSSKVNPNSVLDIMCSNEVEKIENRKYEYSESDFISFITIATIESNSIKELEAKLKVKLS